MEKNVLERTGSAKYGVACMDTVDARFQARLNHTEGHFLGANLGPNWRCDLE